MRVTPGQSQLLLVALRCDPIHSHLNSHQKLRYNYNVVDSWLEYIPESLQHLYEKRILSSMLKKIECNYLNTQLLYHDYVYNH